MKDPDSDFRWTKPDTWSKGDWRFLTGMLAAILALIVLSKLFV